MFDTKVTSPSRRGFLKGMAIGAGAYAFGSSLIYPQLAFGQSIEGYLEKIPMETRWKIATFQNGSNSARLWKASFDKAGREKYIEGTKQMSLKSGAQLKGLADSLGLTGNDVKSMAAMMAALMITLNPQQKFELGEETSEKASLKCINCEIWNAMQKMKITDDICSTGSQYLYEGFAKALNPKITSTMVKARPRGDSVCEWVFELKA